jgi:hypothetical protein
MFQDEICLEIVLKTFADRQEKLLWPQNISLLLSKVYENYFYHQHREINNFSKPTFSHIIFELTAQKIMILKPQNALTKP